MFTPNFDDSLYYVAYTNKNYSLHKTTNTTTTKLDGYQLDTTTFAFINSNLTDFITTGSLKKCHVVIDDIKYDVIDIHDYDLYNGIFHNGCKIYFANSRYLRPEPQPRQMLKNGFELDLYKFMNLDYSITKAKLDSFNCLTFNPVKASTDFEYTKNLLNNNFLVWVFNYPNKFYCAKIVDITVKPQIRYTGYHGDVQYTTIVATLNMINLSDQLQMTCQYAVNDLIHFYKINDFDKFKSVIQL